MKRQQEESCSVDLRLKKARQVEDIFDILPAFRSYSKGDFCVRVQSYTAKVLPKEFLQWSFNLCKENMQAYYEEVWGWSDVKKLRQLKAAASRFLIAFRDGCTSSPVAFVNYRLEKDGDAALLYLYELQIHESAQRRGLGKWLMALLEEQARTLHLDKVMLTALNNNPGALALYQNMAYTVDPDDLSQQDPPDPQQYTILSKVISQEQS